MPTTEAPVAGRERHAVQDGRGAVVEQAFRLHQQPQPPLTPASLNVAMTETGSVAEMSTPRDGGGPRPARDDRRPSATRPAASTMPTWPRDDDAGVARSRASGLQRRLEDERREQRREDQFAGQLDWSEKWVSATPIPPAEADV